MSYGNPKRSIRMEDDLWHEFLAATKTAGENASSVVRGLVREWLDGYTTTRGNGMSDKTERDELTDIIATHRNEYAHITAGRILAAGYRKPGRRPQPDADGFYSASYVAPRLVQPAPEAIK